MPLLSRIFKSSSGATRVSALLLPTRTLYARPVPKPSSLGTVKPSAASSSPLQQTQSRKLADFPPGHGGKNDMGGPGGQELYPASAPLRRKFEYETFYGVLLACSAMAIAKLAQWNRDPNATYVLVHDNTKGELDDVKFIPVTLPVNENRQVPTVSNVQRWA